LKTLGGGTYLVKYDSSGNVLWAEQSKCSDTAYVNSIFSDNNGNILVTGNFTGTYSFGSDTLTSLYNINGGDIFLTKYAPTGNVLWAKQSIVPSNNSGDWCWSVATDKAGNSYITGKFIDSIIFNSDTLVSHADTANQSDFFLTKYDINGNVLWARHASLYNRASSCVGISVACDAAGNSYAIGDYTDSVSFGAYILNGGSYFVTKYDANGNVLWAKTVTGLGNINSITADAQGNYYIIGAGIEFFIRKYAANSNILWTKQSTNLSGWFGAYPFLSVPDSLNHIYFAGGLGRGSKIIYDKDTITADSGWSDPVMIMELDTAGKPLCFSARNTGGDDEIIGLAVSPSGRFVYLGGDIYSTIIYGKDTLRQHSGIEPPFIARWQPCSNQIVEDINEENKNNTACILYPNPNTGNFQIAISQQLSANSQIEVYNILGEQVYQAPLNATTTQISMSNKAEGLYLYRVVTEKGNLVGEGKFVIQR
jgi:hypothetical protein